eukprot:6707094-Alexandrium_andersonii.AAC.1
MDALLGDGWFNEGEQSDEDLGHDTASLLGSACGDGGADTGSPCVAGKKRGRTPASSPKGADSSSRASDAAKQKAAKLARRGSKKGVIPCRGCRAKFDADLCSTAT